MQYHDTWRTIWTDGAGASEGSRSSGWYGYAIGRWEGDAFVVESMGYDDRTWIDHFGNPHSDQMRLVERFRRVDKETLKLDMTLTDPKTYTRRRGWRTPFTFVNPKAAIFEGDLFARRKNAGLAFDEIRDESKARVIQALILISFKPLLQIPHRQ